MPYNKEVVILAREMVLRLGKLSSMIGDHLGSFSMKKVNHLKENKMAFD